MHPYLSRLGVRQAVQAFFDPFYRSDHDGNLCFSYTAGFEHYGMGFHRLPLSSGYWLAGNESLAQVSRVIVCASAMDAIAWLELHAHHTADWHSLLFFSAGGAVQNLHMDWLHKNCKGKQLVLALGNDPLSRLSALQLAAGLRGFPLQVCYLAEEKVQLRFRGRTYLVDTEKLSLHAFEKMSGFRFRVLTSTPKNYNTFFEQLKAAAGLTF